MRLRIVLCFIALLSSAAALLAQNDGSISGTVTDSSGAVVAQASVKMTSREQGTVRTIDTNNAGIYQFQFLPAGTYDFVVSSSGFKTLSRNGVILAVAQSQRIDFSLELGNITETVTISASNESVNTDNADLGAIIDNTKVIEMPLNGRNFFNLAQLTPGVAPPAQGSSLGYRGGFNVLGSCEGCNNFSLNGMDNNNSTTSVPNFRPSIDAIQEFNILTGVYTAQYGYASGGQVIVTTRSGTNQFHGSGYDFLRNQVTDARNFFSPPGPLPSFKRNQFGGTFGGPIRKDKTFFFYSYEGLQTSQGYPQFATVPTLAMDNGDFSGTGKTIKDPTTGVAFANNIIPQSRISPIARDLLAAYPAPTFATPVGQVPNNNYAFGGTRPEFYNEHSLKIDHQFSAKDSAYATANWYRDVALEHGSGTSCTNAALPLFSCHNELRSEIYGISETHIFSPAMVNEARVSVDLIWLPEYTSTAGTDFWGKYGIQPLISPVTVLPNKGYPTLNVTGLTGYGQNDFYFHQPNWQWTDNLSYTHGKHTFKIGLNVVHFASNTENIGSSQGTLNFTNTSAGLTTGYGAADLLLGLPASTTNSPYQYEWYVREAYVAAFLQDDFKVSSNLTLNFGLRWDMNTPPILNDGHLTSFDPVKGIAVTQAKPAQDAPTCCIVVGFPGEHVFKFDWHDYAPRVGFAWQPFHDGKTVVRGGAGTFYNNFSIFNNGMSSLYSGVPYKASYTYTSSTTAQVSLSNPFPTTSAVQTANSANGIVVDLRQPRVYEWSLGIQRQVANDMVAEVNYFGSSGNHLGYSQNINQPAPGPGTPVQVQARRPYTAYGSVGFYEWVGNSRFESVQFNLRKRYGYGLSFLATYQYAHSLDNLGTRTNQFDATTGNESSTFDTRHRIVWSPVYELPFGKGKRFVSGGIPAMIVGGWQVSGLVQWQTGNPLSPTLSGNYSNSGGSVDRPNVSGDPNANAPNTVQQWFNTSVFLPVRAANGAAGATYSFGNAGRGIIISPGVANFDLSIVRNFPIREWARLQFRGEMFDLFNHPNFAYPNVVADNPQFGTISATTTNGSGSRQVQFALKLTF